MSGILLGVCIYSVDWPTAIASVIVVLVSMNGDGG
jgi:hypothetical protein